VKVGITGERYFEVLEGLTGGETIVAGSYQAVRDLQAGDAVKVPEDKKKKAEGKDSARDSTRKGN
jgi:HlyD family secretion protein